MNKTLQDQYLKIKEGNGHKGVFLTEVKRNFSNIVPQSADFTLASKILKDKNIISENIVGMQAINQIPATKKQPFESAFENFLKEAKKKEDKDKAESKKTSKSVEETQDKVYDGKDKKDPNNVIFDQLMTGYYAEMKDPKNAEKTMEELKEIVLKNLAKDPIHYTKDGQFGVKGLGYSDDQPGLGEPKEAKGKHKASGYGDLNENKQHTTSESKIRNVIKGIIKEELSKTPLNENLPKRLKEIENESLDEVKMAKLEKLKAEVEKRQSQLDMIESNEDLKGLTDKKKVKSIQKEIKTLEKAIAKLEKTTKGKAKEVIDEVEEDDDLSQGYHISKRDLELNIDDMDGMGLDKETIDQMVDEFHSNQPEWMRMKDNEVSLLKNDLISKYLGSDND